jgi:ComEC/Rec2-related protein
MAAVAIYSLLTGLPPSIQRATTMLELALVLKLLNRKLSPVFLLCLATAALVIWHPQNIGNVGFQFSVLTTFGLLAMLPPLQEGIGYYTTRWLSGLVLVPAIAQLWIWPLSIAYFNQFPIHSIPLNILSLVLITPLTVLGFTAALLSLISPAVAGWLTLPAKPLLDALLALAQWGGQQSWAQWALPSPSAWVVLALYGLLFVGLGLLYCLNEMPARRKALLGLIPLTLLLGGCLLEKVQHYKQARIELLPLSESHEAYLIKPALSNEYLAILPEQIDYRESRTLADFFRHRNITHLRATLLLPSSTPEVLAKPASRARRGRHSQADEAPLAPKSYLNKAFKDLRMDMLLTGLPSTRVASLDFQDNQDLPQPGIKLNLGSTTLEGHYKALRLLSGPYCLLGIDQPDADNSLDGQHAVPGCGLRVITHDQPSLFAQGPIPANRYYQLIQEDSQLSVYSNQ